MKSVYNPVYHYASLEDESTGIRVCTIQQSPKKKMPAIQAYSGARYSRSSLSLLEILTETETIDKAAERLSNIYGNYGHDSVASLAECNLYFENISLFNALQIFNLAPLHDGQERSTRYQNFKAPNFVRLEPYHNDITEKQQQLIDDFYNILNKQLADYQRLVSPTQIALADLFEVDINNKALQSRTFDTVRYLLPCGLNTSMTLKTSVREWNNLFDWLKVYGNVPRTLAEISTQLFTEELSVGEGYVSEIKELVKSRCDRNESLASTQHFIENILPSLFLLPQRSPKLPNKYVSLPEVSFSDPIDTLINNHYSLIDLLTLSVEGHITAEEYASLGSFFWENSSNRNTIGNLGRSSAIAVKGLLDIGSLRDINRHRSCVRHIPLLHPLANLESEFDRPIKHMYFLCPYLEALPKLQYEYETALECTYKLILQWFDEATEVFELPVASEYTKYLLPMGHATMFHLESDINSLCSYVINLRVRPGGHIAYRHYASAIALRLKELHPLFNTLSDRILNVDTFDREQFLVRC